MILSDVQGRLHRCRQKCVRLADAKSAAASTPPTKRPLRHRQKTAAALTPSTVRLAVAEGGHFTLIACIVCIDLSILCVLPISIYFWWMSIFGLDRVLVVSRICVSHLRMSLMFFSFWVCLTLVSYLGCFCESLSCLLSFAHFVLSRSAEEVRTDSFVFLKPFSPMLTNVYRLFNFSKITKRDVVVVGSFVVPQDLCSF